MLRSVCLLLFSSFLVLPGCSTLKVGSGSGNLITLEACSGSSCETSFLVHSVNTGYLEQVVFEGEVPLINEGIIKNTRAGGRPFLGVGFNSDYPLLVIVPIGQYIQKEGMRVTIVHMAPKAIKLKLMYPTDASIEPTR